MAVGVSERIKSSIREQALTMGRRIDLYFTENMPDLVAKYDLATKRDLANIEKLFRSNEDNIGQLEDWRENSRTRITDLTKRVQRLESKYGIEHHEVK
jgi:hypothetical protein